MLHKYVRYTVKGLAIAIGVLVLVYIAAYTLVAFNKERIIREIKQQVGDKLNGDIKIGGISLGFLNTFPHVSVLLQNVSVTDTLFAVHHHPFFECKKVYLSLSVTSVLQKNSPINAVLIENGRLYVYTDSTGYTNSYLFTPKPDLKAATQTSTRKVDIQNIRLRDVRLTLDDQKKSKLYDFDVSKFTGDLQTTDSTLRLQSGNNILVHTLAFNTALGSFAKEARVQGDFDVKFNKTKKQLTFNDLDLDIKDHRFRVSGAFNLTKEPTFSLEVATKNLDYNFARSLLTEKISTGLSIVKLAKPVDEVNVQISGPLNGGDPLVNASYRCNENKVESPFANFTNCSFTGTYTNEMIAGQPRKDPNSRLHFQNFKGTWQNLTIKSNNIYINNLLFPMVNADIKTDFDLSQLNTLLGSNTVDLHQGKGLLDVTFTGPLQANTKQNTLLNGKCTFSDGVLMYHPRNIEVKNLNGNIVFKNSDVYVNDFSGSVQGNKIIMNGSGKNLLALLKTDPGKMFLDWNLYSPSLNLGSFTSLLRQRTASAPKNKMKSKLGQSLDEIVNQANFHLNLKTDQLVYKRFTGTNVRASLALINENWILNNVSLNQGGGSMTISGALNAKSSRYYESAIKVNVQNVDVNKVFYAFNNFGLNGISYENLRGKLTSTANVTMDIDRNLTGTPSNMNGTVYFSLKKGALLHYEPLRKIGELTPTRRNFDEIYFAELKDTFDIKDREIYINRMQIESTVITLYVQGVYSLRGKTDISIQVPLSNIRSRGDDYKLENKSPDSKAGASIFIRGRPGDDGNIQFKLDLFRKFRKNNDKQNKRDKEQGKTKS